MSICINSDSLSCEDKCCLECASSPCGHGCKSTDICCEHQIDVEDHNNLKQQKEIATKYVAKVNRQNATLLKALELACDSMTNLSAPTRMKIDKFLALAAKSGGQ